MPEFSGRTHVGARAFDASRSFVERAVSFPENVEIERTETHEGSSRLVAVRSVFGELRIGMPKYQSVIAA